MSDLSELIGFEIIDAMNNEKTTPTTITARAITIRYIARCFTVANTSLSFIDASIVIPLSAIL